MTQSSRSSPRTFPRSIQELLIDKVKRHIPLIDAAGIDLPDIRHGTLGPIARSLGSAASLLKPHLLPSVGGSRSEARPVGAEPIRPSA